MCGQKPSILIVDDQVKYLNMLSAILKHDYEVYHATSGEEALQLAVRETLNLILLDVIMPDMNGFEVCKRLKKNEASKEVPIIFVTAMNADVDKMLGFQIGGCDYLEKPCEQRELKEKIKQHIRVNKEA